MEREKPSLSPLRQAQGRLFTKGRGAYSEAFCLFVVRDCHAPMQSGLAMTNACHHPIPSVPLYKISLLSLFTKEGRQYPKRITIYEPLYSHPIPSVPRVMKPALMAALVNSSRKEGWAIEIRALARCQTLLPLRFTMPYSVTIWGTSEAGTVTMSPRSKVGTILEISLPSLSSRAAWRQIKALPPSAIYAPRVNSSWPP